MLKCAINKQIVNKATAGQVKLLTSSWDNTELTPEQFKAEVLEGHAFCNAQLKSAVKRTDQFLCSNSIWLDFDNKETGHQTKLSDVVNSKKIAELAFAVYTSPSHTEEQNRFRLVFLLPEIITDPKEYKTLITEFIHKFGSDPAPSAVTQAFYGNTNAEVFLFGKTLPKEHIDKILENNKKEAAENKIQHNGNITDSIIREMLGCIPTKTDYLTWSKLCHAVNAACNFDRRAAIDIIEQWSPGRGNEVANKLKNPMKNINTGTLVYFAKEYGWRPPDGFYKQKSNKAVDENGNVSISATKFHLIETWLQQNHQFKYNLVNGRYEMIKKGEWVWMKDRDVHEIWRQLNMDGIKAPQETVRGIIESYFSEAYDPIKDYFDTLPDWDNTDYIQDISMRVPVENEFLISWYDYFRRWLIGVYRCAVYHKPNHLCLVLQSSQQGIGKTTFLNKLVPPELNQYYAISQNFDAENKDAMIMLSEKFLINMDELESVSRKEIAALKSMITQEEISTRRAYAHFAETLQRRASFCGSINNTMFLTDMTGSRRFLVVPVAQQIEYKESLNLTQLWAQVKTLASNPENKSWYEGEELKVIESNNEQFQLKTPEEELLLEYFEPVEDENAAFVEKKTTTEICTFLSTKTMVRINPITLGKALQKAGFLRKGVREKGKILYKWLSKPKSSF